MPLQKIVVLGGKQKKYRNHSNNSIAPKQKNNDSKYRIESFSRTFSYIQMFCHDNMKFYHF